MAIVQEMNLNMIPDSAPVIVRIDQYDTGAGRLVAHLYAGNKMYTPAEGSTATIQGTKPDMHGFAYNAVLEDSTVTADLTQQMSCIAGNTRCQFVVVEPTGRTGTFCFVLKVQESALSDDTDISETEIPAIIDAAGKNAEKAEASAEKAEAAVEHYPYINMDNLHWMVWDADTETWIDTGVVAEGSGYTPGLGIKIDQSTISVDSDAAPIEDSQKPVASGGVYAALQDKQDELTFDTVPTDGSNNPVKSNGIYDALQNKQNILTDGIGITIANDVISVDADTTPRSGSSKPVESGGVFTELTKKQDKLTAGENVQIDPDTNTISVTDTTYDPATQAKAGLMSAADKTKLDGIAAGAEVNVQADYTETDASADSYIKHKPTLGTAAAKNATNTVTAGSADLVESGAVKTAIDAAVSSAYKPAGPKTCAELVPALLVEANNGNVYNITDDGVTTEDFIEGAGKPIRTGDNVSVFKNGNVYKFDLLSGFIDTSGFQTKTITGTVEGQMTVEGALGALSTNKQPKNLSTPITVDGTQQTTVEGTLSAINNLAATNKTNKQDKTLSSAIESQATVEGALSALSTNKQPKTLSTLITVDGVQQTTVEATLDAINNLAADNKTNKQNKTLSSAIESQTTVEGALSALSTNKQPKTLSSPITVDEQQQTAVEGALDAINTYAEGIKNGLGTAAAKNAIGVVADSADIVESKAVKNLVGWGNKNLCNPDTFIQALLDESGEANFENRWITSDFIPCNGTVTLSGYKDGSKVNFCVRFAEYNSSKTFIQITTNVNIQDVAEWSRTFTLNANTRYVRMSVGFNNEATTPTAYFATNRLQLERGSTATAYEPYHASVEETLRDAEVVEGKNKLPYPFYETGTKTEHNISIVNNGDGTLSIGTSAKTDAGVRYGLTGVGVADRRPISEIQNKILVINATGNNFGLGIWYYNSLTYLSVEYINTNKKPTIPNNCDSYVLFANVPSGTTPTGTIKPMIVDATETDYSFVPYYIPLKDVVPTKADNSVIGTVEDGTNPTKSYAVGEHMIRGGKFCTVTSPVTISSTWTLGSNYVEGTIADNLVYKAGDTILISSNNRQFPVSGYLTSSGKQLYFSIPLNKPLAKGVTISFSNTSSILVRGIGGYVLNDSPLSNFNITVKDVFDVGILFCIENTDASAFNGTNNTAINVALKNCSIIFS